MSQTHKAVTSPHTPTHTKHSPLPFPLTCSTSISITVVLPWCKCPTNATLRTSSGLPIRVARNSLVYLGGRGRGGRREGGPSEDREEEKRGSESGRCTYGWLRAETPRIHPLPAPPTTNLPPQSSSGPTFLYQYPPITLTLPMLNPLPISPSYPHPPCLSPPPPAHLVFRGSCSNVSSPPHPPPLSPPPLVFCSLGLQGLLLQCLDFLQLHWCDDGNLEGLRGATRQRGRGEWAGGWAYWEGTPGNMGG